MEEKWSWDKLFPGEKEVYLKRAAELQSLGLHPDMDLDTLGKIIYEKTNKPA